jgi:hypothetical protein
MKKSIRSPHRRAPRTDAAQRVQLLAAFDRSELSAAAFARQHGIHYTTFCGWRQRRVKGSPGFVQVELPESTPPVELVVELGATARLRLRAGAQIPLAAQLIQSLNPSLSC